MTVRYLDNVNGHDGNNGSLAGPYGTLQKAIDCTPAGDVLAIKGGDSERPYLLEADGPGVGGTVSGTTITRSSGTWTPDLEVGKRAFFIVGQSDGYGHKITANTSTTLTLVRAPSGGDGSYTVVIGDQDKTSIDLDNSGNLQANKPVVIKGYKSSFDESGFVSDMDCGGAHYQSPLDAYINGIDETKWVGVDACNLVGNVFEVDGDFIMVHNFYLHNTSGATNKNILNFSSTPKGIFFIHCAFDDAYKVMDSFADFLVFVDCFIGSSMAAAPMPLQGNGVIIDRCVIDCPAYCSVGGTGGFGVVLNSILTEQLWGVSFGGGSIYGTGNTFYNNTEAAIRVNNASSLAAFYNNIFMLADKTNDYGVKIESSGGAFVGDYNCWSALDGQLVNFGTNLYSGGAVPQAGKSALQIDPGFVNAVGGDFKPRHKDVLRGGVPDVSGNSRQMGAVSQAYQFADRARTSNAGRLRILK